MIDNEINKGFDCLDNRYAPSMRQICNDCTCHSGQDDTVAEEVCNYMWQAQRCGVAACESPLKVNVENNRGNKEKHHFPLNYKLKRNKIIIIR